MMQSPGHASRNLLAAAILVALTGSTLAADPSLKVVTPVAEGVTTERVLELSGVRYELGSSGAAGNLVATSVAGNVDCGTVSAPAAGVLRLTLDGKQYAVRTSALPSSLSSPIAFSPAASQFTLSLVEVASSNCASTGLTAFDIVVYGDDGSSVTARSRIAQAPYLLLPDGTPADQPVAVLTAADPISCESFGVDAGGIDQQLTGFNGDLQLLFGFDRIQYPLQVNAEGRRELRHYPKLSATGVPLVQCTSPGFLMGNGAASAPPPEFVFESGFELRESAADVLLLLASNSFLPELPVVPGGSKRLGFVEDAGGAYLTLTVRNFGRSAADRVKVREFLRRNGASLVHVVAGSDPISCTPLPADATPNPCDSLAVATGVVGTDPLQFPLAFDIPQLKAGEGVELRLHRELVVPPDSPTDQVAVGYAAFVNPSPPVDAGPDLSLGNNAQWVDFAVS